MTTMTTINDEARTRILEDAETATRNGFALPPTLFAEGTRLIDAGVAKFARSRAKFEEMTPARDACEALFERVRAEDRQDELVPLAAARMLPTGDLMIQQANLRTFAVEEPAFRRLASFVAPGGGPYLAACPPALRAINFNHWSPASEDVVKLRTRKNAEGGRTAWAAVGKIYQACDADRLAALVAKVAGSGARAEVTYDGYRTRINVLWHSDIRPEGAAVGEIYKAGFSATTADDGTQSIEIDASILRAVCVNLTSIPAIKRTGRRIHVGRTVEQDVANAINEARSLVKTFGEAWAAAEKDRVLDGCQEPRTKFEILVNRGLVQAEGVTKQELTNRLYKAWQKEPGYSRNALVNAITRAAHENPWRSPWVEDSLQQQAGQLLYAKVLTLN